MESMNTEIRSFVEDEAQKLGWSKPLVEFANVSDIPVDAPDDFPYNNAVAIAIPIDPHIVAQLENGPTFDYYNENMRINDQILDFEHAICEKLQASGHSAKSLNDYLSEETKAAEEDPSGNSPNPHYAYTHRLIATHAGLGWLGKNGLIITKHYGPAVRLSTILTDTPFDCCTQVFLSRCARCMECVTICPANAINPFEGSHKADSQEIVNMQACIETCHELSMKNFGMEADICSLCIYACPYTKAYLHRNGIINY